MNTKTDILTIGDAVDLGTICRWTQTWAQVRWLTDNGDILCGTVRNIGDENGNVVTNRDVRDCFLRISATFEHFLPMRDVMAMLRDGRIGEDTP